MSNNVSKNEVNSIKMLKEHANGIQIRILDVEWVEMRKVSLDSAMADDYRLKTDIHSNSSKNLEFK